MDAHRGKHTLVLLGEGDTFSTACCSASHGHHMRHARFAGSMEYLRSDVVKRFVVQVGVCIKEHREDSPTRRATRR